MPVRLSYSEDEVEDLIQEALSGRISVSLIEKLLRVENVHLLGKHAHDVRTRLCGRYGTFVVNMVLNYTNVCYVRCKFCAFWRDRSAQDAYVLVPEEAARLVKYVDSLYGPLRQVLVQGGINPEVSIEYIEQLFRCIKRHVPHVAIHGLSPLEVHYICVKERLSYREAFERLKEAGLDSMPGGGGEILVDNVRRVISPGKISSDTWIRVMEEAHRVGIKTSATMMYGHIETISEQAQHLYRIYELQLKTGGFNAFIAWNFEPKNTHLEKMRIIKYPEGPYTLLKIVSTARLVFRHHIPHIQSSWLTNGLHIAQLSLLYGADDFGGTLYNEKVVPAAGVNVPVLTRADIVHLIRKVGLVPAERDNFYNIVKVYGN